MKKISNESFYEERPLYGIKDAELANCFFSSEQEGESAFKEASNISIIKTKFSMRYPFWHTRKFIINDSILDNLTRASIWYSCNGQVYNTKIDGVKCLRESDNILFDNCEIESAEFGWKCKDIKINKCSIISEYLFFDSKDIEINSLNMSGKYSFQYVDGMKIKNSELNTKDAFWHSNNVIVEDTIIRGEYLGWYSKNLTLINCTIIGTQPLCYSENLKMINCKMVNADLSFEYSSVNVDVNGDIDSIKNVRSGNITANSIGKIINENSLYPVEVDIMIKTLKDNIK